MGLLFVPWELGGVKSDVFEDRSGCVRWFIIGLGFALTWGLFSICGRVCNSCWADPFVRRWDIVAGLIRLLFILPLDVGGAGGGGGGGCAWTIKKYYTLIKIKKW